MLVRMVTRTAADEIRALRPQIADRRNLNFTIMPPRRTRGECPNIKAALRIKVHSKSPSYEFDDGGLPLCLLLFVFLVRERFVSGSGEYQRDRESSSFCWSAAS